MNHRQQKHILSAWRDKPSLGTSPSGCYEYRVVGERVYRLPSRPGLGVVYVGSLERFQGRRNELVA